MQALALHWHATYPFKQANMQINRGMESVIPPVIFIRLDTYLTLY